jgi:hypothetical protein
MTKVRVVVMGDEMSAHNAPAALFLEPAPGLSVGQSLPEHHPQPAPSDHMCTCGKVREACVHDEIRAFWSAVAAVPPPNKNPS